MYEDWDSSPTHLETQMEWIFGEAIVAIDCPDLEEGLQISGWTSAFEPRTLYKHNLKRNQTINDVKRLSPRLKELLPVKIFCITYLCYLLSAFLTDIQGGLHSQYMF